MSKLRKSRFFKPLVWLTAILFLAACNYYRVRRLAPDHDATVENIGMLYKHFYIHEFEGNIFYLTDIKLAATILSGEAEILPEIVHIYLPEYKKDYQYYHKYRDKVQQVHFFLKPDVRIKPGHVNLDLSQFSYVRITEKDHTKTIVSHMAMGIGIPAGILGIVAIVIALTKSSCPYVYVENEEGLTFQGEIFGGALLHNLERDDYLPLPDIRPVDGAYRIRIANELKERQYTNMAHLLTVDHSPQMKVLLDQSGQPHAIETPQPPAEAYNSLGLDVSDKLCLTDDYVYPFDDPNSTTDGLILEFDKPSSAEQARLLLNARNSLWLEHIYGRFTEQFGSFYNPLIELQKKQSRETREQKVIQQHFGLSVFVERNRQWELLERIPTIGPLASRDIVVPVSLEGTPKDRLKIRITTGFMFWDLDLVAMDFGEQPELEVRRLFPKSAVNSENRDYLQALWSADSLYMEQTIIGEQTEVRYDATPLTPEMKRSVFLHSSGYYEHIREYRGLPDIEFVSQFSKPGHFHRFSQTEYDRVLNQQPALAVRP